MRRRRGFTLVEILVVLAIFLLVTVVALPAVYSSLNGRQVTDAARIFSGALVGIRDSAIRYNEPRGIRLLPDPTLTLPAPGSPSSGSLQLCYNRMIPIEPAGDYSQGKVSIGPQYYAGGNPAPAAFPPIYNTQDGGSYRYPFWDTDVGTPSVLMIEECPYAGGYVSSPVVGMPNSPTNWYWNIRVGDKIKINGTGRAYTIVGPCVVNPWGTTPGTQGNPEMFVNVGPPGTTPPLTRAYYPPPAGAPPASWAPFDNAVHPEFLFLVNGEDDSTSGFDHLGYIDEGFDGVNNNPPPAPPGNPGAFVDDKIDELTEWEQEKWLGSLEKNVLPDIPTNTPQGSPSADWLFANQPTNTQDVPYIIKRRPVPSPGAREITLPPGMVIDATTWNTTRERSRLPIQPGSLYVDIMVNPNGQYIPTTQYSSPTSAGATPFLHFWITERGDVYPRGSVWGTNAAGAPNPNPSNAGGFVYFELPLTPSALGGTSAAPLTPTTDGQYYPGSASGVPVLKGDRRLVTMFNQSGLITTNTIESVAPPAGVLLPGEGFHVSDVSYPFYKAQQGSREAR